MVVVWQPVVGAVARVSGFRLTLYTPGRQFIGVDSVELPLKQKERIGSKLAGDWKVEALDQVCTEIGLDQLEASLATILSGGAVGRYLLNCSVNQ